MWAYPGESVPWGDDFDVWFETLKGEIKMDLVTSFAAAPMCYIAVERFSKNQKG